MSDLVNVKIDGKDYKVPGGIYLIEAAESVGVDIPNLCYMKGMKGVGACRLCVVDADGKTVTSCTIKTKDGMNIVTENEKILEMRKFVIDLIVSMHPLDCMTCTKAGGCSLQQYAYDFEIKESTFSRKKFGFPVDEANPFIKRDPDYCILCSRCVRACKEQGTSVLDFSGRGVGSKVVTADDRPLQDSGCTFCGSCVDACPVNALLESDRWRKGREWEYERTASVCTRCGCACDITVSSYGEDITKINSGAETGAAESYICAIGRFGFDSLTADTRVNSPMIKSGSKFKEVSWDEAIKEVSKKLKGTSAGILASGTILNEDALTIAQFAKSAKMKNVTSSVSAYADSDSLSGDAVDLEGADLIVLAGIDPSQWKRTLPALDAIVRKKASRGAKLIVINAKDTSVSVAADISVKGDEAGSLKALAKALVDTGLKAPKGLDTKGAKVSDDIKEAAELYSKAEAPVVVSSPGLLGPAVNVSLIKGSAVSVPLEANAKGTMLMGIKPDPAIYKDMMAGKVKSLLVVGDVPVSKRPKVDFLAVQTSHMTDLAKKADVILPAADALESEGSIVDYLGRFKELDDAVTSPGEARQHKDIIALIAKERKYSVKAAKSTDTRKLSKPKAKLSAGPFKKNADLDISIEKFNSEVHATVTNGSRLFWLKEVEKEAVGA
ncbi:MAG: molybdopterin-dependent oxidoreductase [Nitrospirota bacterium]|nr:MAG: molybdopterin-dependent oxidoreductase [Nitrospirota bacterium]